MPAATDVLAAKQCESAIQLGKMLTSASMQRAAIQHFHFHGVQSTHGEKASNRSAACSGGGTAASF